MLHANLKLDKVYMRDPAQDWIPLGCAECQQTTPHAKTERGGKEVYRCVKCGRVTERQWNTC